MDWLFWIFLFVFGVEMEHYLGLHDRGIALLGWIWEKVCQFFEWIGRMLEQLFELISRFLKWLLGLIPWWLWFILLLLLALIFWLVLSLWMLAVPLAILALILLCLNGLWALLVGLILALLAFLAWFADLFGGLGKWLAGALSVLALSIPTCSQAPVPTPAPQKQEEKPVVMAPPVKEPEILMIAVQNGDGCIRATARGGYPMDLSQCIAWTREQGLRVRNVRGHVHAPTLYLGDSLEYKDGLWILHRPMK